MIENISTVIISKNASKTIKTTLDSLKKFKEVILFDNGSTDDTLYIAGTYNNVIISKGKFIGFGATKNHAITFAKNNWIFSIDADESITEELYLHLLEIDLQPKLIGEIKRKNYFIGKEIRVAGWGRDTIIRLFNRTEFQFSDDQVHEKVEIDGSARKVILDGGVKHLAINDLSQTLEKANLYSELFAKKNEKLFPFWVILLKTQYAFFRTFFLQLGFLAGWRGFVLALSNSIGVFYKYSKIYAINKQKNENSKIS